MLDELEHVRAVGAGEPDPDELIVAAARAELARAISAAATGPRVRTGRAPRRQRQRQRHRRAVLAAAIAAAAVTIAGALGLTTATSPPTALAAAMDRLAQIAAGQTWTGTPAPGQYQYTDSEGVTEADTGGNGQECQISQVDHRQIWIATNGAGAISETRNQGRFTSAADQAICGQFGITDPNALDNTSSNSYPPGGLSVAVQNWHTLSADPARLLIQLRALDGGPSTPGEDFVHIGDFLRETDAPPAIRAALYHAAALIPGAHLLGPQTDPTGRTGLGVQIVDAQGDRHELIFDQQTAMLLADETFLPGGTLDQWTAYLSSQLVDSHPDYPVAAGSSSTVGSTPAAGSPAPAG